MMQHVWPPLDVISPSARSALSETGWSKQFILHSHRGVERILDSPDSVSGTLLCYLSSGLTCEIWRNTTPEMLL